MTAPQLDIEQHDALITYLQQSGRIAPGQSPRCTTLAGGVSNRTVLVELPDGQAWVLKQALAKLRVKVDWFSDPARIHREALGLTHLAKVAPPGTITPLIFEDPAHHLLAMQAVPQPHENLKTLLLSGALAPAAVRAHAVTLGGMLGWIHRESGRQNRTLAKTFDDRTFFETLRLEPYYQYTATQQPASQAFYDKLVAATRTRRMTLVHGDFSPKNILVRGNDLVLLDHEVVHWGDPAFDLGFMLAHLLSKAHHLPEQREAFREAAHAFWHAYLKQTRSVGWNKDLDVWAARHAIGCLLARVDGRSPLEYLTPEQRDRQREKILYFMQRFVLAWPEGIEPFIDHFVAQIAW